MPASPEELALDLSRPAIDQQERRQAELRSRASTVLAAASIAGSFLAGQAANHHHVGVLGLMAATAYLLCFGATLYVLLPHQLVLEFRGSVALEQSDASEADLDELQRAVSGWLDEFHERNRKVLEGLADAYTFSCTALGLEILLWTAGYADKLV